MSVIPLLVRGYFVNNYIFVKTAHSVGQVSLIVLFTLWIPLSGYLLIKELIMPIVGLSLETKLIASGNYNSKIDIARDDELGIIADSVNKMTGKIQGYIGDLQDYRKKTAALNVCIHRKVLTLTNLMRLGDLISSGTNFSGISKFATERMAEEMYGGFCGIFMKGKTGAYFMSSFANHSDREMDTADMPCEHDTFEKHFEKKEYISVDSRPLMKAWEREMREKLGWMNVVLFPLKAADEMLGVIVYGNYAQDVEFDTEEIGILRAYEKELVLGYQGNQAVERMKDLEMVDSVTGLYTFSYIEGRLSDEINRSVFYQRPCSLILMNVDNLPEHEDEYSKEKADGVLREIGRVLAIAVPPVVKIGRSENGGFALLVPEANKREAIDLAGQVRDRMKEICVSPETDEKLEISIGVGENPMDGANAYDIVVRARENMRKASQKGPNNVVGD